MKDELVEMTSSQMFGSILICVWVFWLVLHFASRSALLLVVLCFNSDLNFLSWGVFYNKQNLRCHMLRVREHCGTNRIQSIRDCYVR